MRTQLMAVGEAQSDTFEGFGVFVMVAVAVGRAVRNACAQSRREERVARRRQTAARVRRPRASGNCAQSQASHVQNVQTRHASQTYKPFRKA